MESSLFLTDLLTGHEPEKPKSLEINGGISRFMGSLHDSCIAHWGHERRQLARSPDFSRPDVLPPKGGTPCKSRFMERPGVRGEDAHGCAGF